MKELTFREVIANIKEGEVWENASAFKNLKQINKKGRLINFVFTDTDRESFAICNDDTFILQRKTYSFTEALKAYEEGKEIESCINSDWRYKLGYTELLVYAREIKGEWYIND